MVKITLVSALAFIAVRHGPARATEVGERAAADAAREVAAPGQAGEADAPGDAPAESGVLTISSKRPTPATRETTTAVPTVATPAPAPAPAAAPRALTMEDVSNPSTEELRIGGVHARYSLNFFGDTSLSLGRPSAPDHFLGFAFGAQDLLIKGDLGNHIAATTEIAMEPGPDGIGVDIERFNIRWHSETFFIEAGRSHTAFGYWNNAYHHGSWLQPSIERPRWVAFEDGGGMLPVHWVGLDTGAKVKGQWGTLNLFASVGNGRGKIVDDVRNAGDYQSLKALHLAAEFVGIHWPELRAGLSVIIDRIPAQPAMAGGVAVRPALPDQPIDELIGGAYLAYPSFPLVLIAEGYTVIHRAKTQQFEHQQWTTTGGFVLLGYAFGRYTPYGEFERVASRGGPDPFFIPDPMAADVPSFDTVKGIVGLRIDLSDWTALKVEYRITRLLDTASTFQEGIVNWSWGF